MKRTNYFISKLLKYGTLLSTLGLIGSVLIQIFGRFLLDNTPPWTEEASRLFFIYAISFASGLALKNQYYVHWDLLYNKLSVKGRKFMDVFIPLLTFLLFILMAIFSLRFVQMGLAETSPSMGINMSVPFLSMTVMSAALSYYSALDLQKAIKHYTS